MDRPTGRRIFYSYPHDFGDNDPHSDHHGSSRLQKHREKAQFAALILLAALQGGCGNSGDSERISAADLESAVATTANSTPSFLPASGPAAADCGDNGALKTTLYGALAGEVEWHPADMRCEGMPRPNGAGARLRFAGDVGANAMQLAFIIALPDLERGIGGAGFTSNVTVIDEGSSRFFSTPDLESCWTDVEAHVALDDDNSGDRFVIDGTLYCISPLPEINGDASISIPELRFSGQLDWGPQ